jgi:pimeloyl-ACP methyl ester carboxylesterase
VGRVIESFRIDVPDAALDDLRMRIRRTRWPAAAPGEPWSQGTDLDYLRGLLDYWADGFDWRGVERALNGVEHLRVDVDGVAIHVARARSRVSTPVPLILTHGWPSLFVEYMPLVPLLADPADLVADGRGFDLVLPSLPGYGYSERPARTGVTTRQVAAMWHRLMRSLGYHRFWAVGSDFGSAVTTHMALDDPAPLVGIYLSNLDLDPYTGPGSPPPTDAERAYLAERDAWDRVERGYSSIQSTKPQTVSYGLTDSPAGLAAWVIEKWRSWADSGGDIEQRVPRDTLLTILTLFWVTGSIGSSMRDYYDDRWFGSGLGPTERVRVPTAFAGFGHEFVHEGAPPRSWVERIYDVRHWTEMPRGGHFAATEEPALLARDIAAFFASL